MKYSEFCILSEVAENGDAIIGQIKALSRPQMVCGVETPTDLNKISLGQYLALTTMTKENALTAPLEIVLGVTQEQIANERAEVVLGFTNFVSGEMQRIGKLFSSTNVPPTEEEKRAGVDKLNFGAFGLIDWFALRMGIDHDKAEETPWVRVYKCLDIDAKKQIYERRLRKTISSNNKNKHR